MLSTNDSSDELQLRSLTSISEKSTFDVEIDMEEANEANSNVMMI